MNRPTRILVTALFTAVSFSFARADVLFLKDGRVFDGVDLQPEEEHLLIEFEHGLVRVPLDSVHEYLDEDGGSTPEPTTEQERARFAKGDVRYEGRWMSVKKRDRLIAKRLEERREQMERDKRQSVWRNRLQEETKNFAFESTVPSFVFEHYRDLCEAYYSAFAKEWKIRKPRGIPPLPIKIYSDREEFVQVTRSSALAFFRFIEPWQLHMYYDRLDGDYTEEVMYHELGHFLQRLINVDFKYPHWPGESLCEYYGASTWDPETSNFTPGGLHEGRIVSIRSDIEKGRWVGLREMIEGCQARNGWDYSWGWSLVHFLMNDKGHAKNFKRFFIALARGKDIDRRTQSFGNVQLQTVMGPDMLAAFRKYMKVGSDEELKQLEKDWYAYIEELPVRSVRGLRRAAARARSEGRVQRAKRLYEETIETGEAIASDHFHRGNLLESLGERKAARESWLQAIELDPLVADYHIELGKDLLEKTESLQEGKRRLLLARDIEPDNFYLERNLDALIRRAEKKASKAREASSSKK